MCRVPLCPARGAAHLRILRQAEPLPLQLLDGRLHLREGGADVGQLDDVGVRGGRERPQLREGVVLLLPVGKVRGEAGEDAARERDVAALHCQPRGPEVGLDDGQEGVRGQCRGFVGECVDDLGGCGGGGGGRRRHGLGHHRPLGAVAGLGGRLGVEAAGGGCGGLAQNRRVPVVWGLRGSGGALGGCRQP